jgi:hypothetical protein
MSIFSTLNYKVNIFSLFFKNKTCMNFIWFENISLLYSLTYKIRYFISFKVLKTI